MRIKLKDIADVAIGQSFRNRLERDDEANVSVLQMKDLTAENRIDSTALARVYLKKINERQLIKKNDIIFRARGLTNTAAHIDQNIGQAVVAAPLLRIRISDKSVLPEYLIWWINQPKPQAYLASHAEGTAQKKISVQVLKELYVEVPPVEKQKQIVELANLAREEQKLLCELANKRTKVMEGILMQIALVP
jgi:restriction endonuclease S subunit